MRSAARACTEIDRAQLRRALSAVPTCVTVVSAADGEVPFGLVAGSFVSISLEPPLVGFFVATSSTSWPNMARAGRFAVNVLAAGQDSLCARFARSGGDKFTGVRWIRSALGNPLLPGAVLWIDCWLWETRVLGDHLLVVGRVVTFEEPGSTTGVPLVFHSNDLRALPPEWA
ncbi:flavin reductase family protein [Streptomyces sp. LaPpAH-108]|uniref:flavin reductase family protein n=1 Tax=Streptomyces sp. LaPpAH-108 TaxID=1155714 RepID=UPI00037BC5FD|nr:flavin reductase family protein [Streptomyces sp. LaPpAH-108]